MLCSLNVKKKYGMIKDRTEKDTLVTEVFRYNGTVQAGIYRVYGGEQRIEVRQLHIKERT